MRIVHVTLYHWPRFRTCGPVVYLHALAREQAGRGHEVEVVCGSERTVPGGAAYAQAGVDVEDGIAYVHLGNRPAQEHDPFDPAREAHDPALLQALTQVLRERAPDV